MNVLQELRNWRTELRMQFVDSFLRLQIGGLAKCLMQLELTEEQRIEMTVKEMVIKGLLHYSQTEISDTLFALQYMCQVCGWDFEEAYNLGKPKFAAKFPDGCVEDDEERPFFYIVLSAFICDISRQLSLLQLLRVARKKYTQGMNRAALMDLIYADVAMAIACTREICHILDLSYSETLEMGKKRWLERDNIQKGVPKFWRNFLGFPK